MKGKEWKGINRQGRNKRTGKQMRGKGEEKRAKKEMKGKNKPRNEMKIKETKMEMKIGERRR